MKITVESFGIPTLSALIGKRAELDFQGGTVSDFVDQMIGRFGAKDRKILLNGEGQLDLTIQVMVNEGGFLVREELPNHWLKDGDHIRFVLLADGG